MKAAKVAEKCIYAISTVFDAVYRALLAYANVVLLAIVFIVSAQVISRKFLGGSIQWSEEVARLLMVWMAFVSMAIGIQKSLHVSIEVFYNKFPRPLQTVCRKINEAIIFLCGLVMTVYGIKLIISTSTSTLSATQWPACTLYLMIPVAGVLVCYLGAVELFGLQKYVKTKIEAPENPAEEAEKAQEGAAV